MASCPTFDPSGAYVSNVLGWMDCRVLAFGTNGYAALGPGSAYGAAWTGLFTILVALFGYRLLFSGTVVIRDVMVTILKIGAVLALAGQWPAYRVLVYDIFASAPSRLTADLTVQSGVSSASIYRLAYRVDGANAAIADFIPPPSQLLPPPPNGEEAAPQPPQSPGALSQSDQTKIGWAGTLMTVSTLGGLLLVRIISGILLGLGPLFIACLLFPATQGLFIGWLRVLIGAALGSITASIIVAMELAIIEAQIVALGDLVSGGQPAGTLPTAIFSTGLLFVVLMLAALAALARLTAAWNLPSAAFVPNVLQSWRSLRQTVMQDRAPSHSREPAVALAGSQTHGRAQSVSEAFQALDRREEQMEQAQVRLIKAGEMNPAGNNSNEATSPLPLGQSARRTAPRKSASGDRRNELR